ncbi:CHAT domain-containing protein [Streptomyces endophyticus]|uniref:CHAT domain-containing protein n=1 Tax=Streptomyces endophyticus TaxID=714166 RepID=A0ABU6FAG8_9ACTN|nr:CHAT domain-containing protein [Streptomyces endophyticus]MEB8340607.1 CHAT domain-containing protein [Streptomyces endophyticus]
MTDAVLRITEERVQLHTNSGEFEWALGDELVEIARDPAGVKAMEFTAALEFGASPQHRTDIGLRLYRAVFDAAPAGRWEELQDEASEKDPLHVRIDIECPALARLPWELMRDKRQTWSRNNRVLLRRGRRVGISTESPPELGPLRVLLVVCNPSDRRLLADQELAMIGAALTQLPGRVHTEVIDGPSLRELIAEVAHVRPHVLHFIGHGMRAVAGDTGGLHFNAAQPVIGPPDPHWEEPEESWTLGPEQMDHLYASWKPRLVVLNACRQAHAPAAEFADLIETCLERGSLAVVAMQADIESPAAAEFSHSLYQDLADARSIDAAVTAARNHLHIDDSDGPSWALPVLQCGVEDPRDVVRVEFGHPEPALTRWNKSWPFAELAMFVGRAKERRTGWWEHPDDADAAPPDRLLAITSARQKAGKTWLAKWCLLTCMLRGEDVTYADLADYTDRGDSDEPVTLGWPAVLRALREACTDDKRQPNAMHVTDFARFNQVLNLASQGGRRWAEGMPSPAFDLGQPFMVDADRHAEARRAEIFQAFLNTLRNRAVARRRPHLLAIDNVQRISESEFSDALLPLLLGPVQEAGGDFPLRILTVAPQSWPGFRHLQKFMEGSPVVLTDLQQPDYKRLAREFWERQRHENKVLRRQRFRDFEALLDGMNGLKGHQQSFHVGMYQRVLDTWLAMGDVDGMEEAG